MSIARKLARGGRPPVSPLIPPSDTLRLFVGEHGQSPHSRHFVAHSPRAEGVAS
jgi:hypothetical protein